MTDLGTLALVAGGLWLLVWVFVAWCDFRELVRSSIRIAGVLEQREYREQEMHELRQAIARANAERLFTADPDRDPLDGIG